MDCNVAEKPNGVREKDSMVLVGNEELEYLKARFEIRGSSALIHD